jgi:uroporphyrinogen-III synthase
MRIVVPDTMKYFCISQAAAYYLQKYIIYRKRKIFYGEKKFEEVMNSIYKHRDERYLLPLSDAHKTEIPRLLDKNRIKYTKAIMYRTVSCDLSDIKKDFNYDLICFFSPAGIKSLFDNFPNFRQDGIRIGGFGPSTNKAIIDAGLRLDIEAPTPDAPSMTAALDQYLARMYKENR